jgi:hypothetical protein
MTITLQAASDFDLETLRAVISGADSSLVVGQALALLLSHSYPNADKVFEEVLGSSERSNAVRSIAAANLGVLARPSAEAALLRQIDGQPEEVLMEIVKSLGRFAGDQALPALRKLQEYAKGRLARQIDFALCLISARCGLKDKLVKLPAHPRWAPLPEDCRALARVRPASQADFDACIQSLADEPIGVAFDEASAIRIDIEHIEWMVLLNCDIVAPRFTAASCTVPRIVGAIAEWDATDELFYLLHVILVSPSKPESFFKLHTHDEDGGIAHIGHWSGHTCGDFELKAVSDTALPIHFSGRFRGNKLTFDTLEYGRELTQRKLPKRLQRTT